MNENVRVEQLVAWSICFIHTTVLEVHHLLSVCRFVSHSRDGIGIGASRLPRHG